MALKAIDFTSKKPEFDFNAVPVDWCEMRHMKILWEAASVIAPEAERFIMRSVMAYRDHPVVSDDPWLASLIDEFMEQEREHTRIHVSLNKALGIDHIEGLTSLRDELRQLTDDAPAIEALAVAAAMEHLFFAAIKLTFIESGFYKDHRVDTTVRRFFLWHWCEELEHHSVTLSLLSALDSTHRVRWQAVKHVFGRFMPACTAVVMELERHHSPTNYRSKAAIDIPRLLLNFVRGASVFSKFMMPSYDPVKSSEWSWPYIEEWRRELGYGQAVTLNQSNSDAI